MVEIGKNLPSLPFPPPPNEVEPQRGAKQQRGLQTWFANEAEQKGDHRAAVLAWAPHMELNVAPLLSDAFIQDFQQGTAGYVADVMEQSLLMPRDMANLRSMRQHEVFLRLKRDLAMVNEFLRFFFFFFKTILLFLSRPSKPLLGPRRW